MATGRTILKHTRVYVDGYDLSGYSRAIGPLGWKYDETDLTVITDDIKGALPAHATLSVGALNGVMDYTATSSLHVGDNFFKFVKSAKTLISMKPTTIIFSILHVLPGTVLYEQSQTFGLKFDEKAPHLVLDTPTFPYEEIDKAVVMAYSLDKEYNIKPVADSFRTG